nr:hypothetical protein [Tanacetum cinerariifolium]
CGSKAQWGEWQKGAVRVSKRDSYSLICIAHIYSTLSFPPSTLVAYAPHSLRCARAGFAGAVLYLAARRLGGPPRCRRRQDANHCRLHRRRGHRLPEGRIPGADAVRHHCQRLFGLLGVHGRKVQP